MQNDVTENYWSRFAGTYDGNQEYVVGMHLLDKFKLGLRFFKAWGKPPKHTHIFSPESLAALMQDVGFDFEDAKLIGNRSKAVFIIGRKA